MILAIFANGSPKAYNKPIRVVVPIRILSNNVNGFNLSSALVEALLALSAANLEALVGLSPIVPKIGLANQN
ncbi:hypothetical protein D3C72_2205340 [compost metagenome]